MSLEDVSEDIDSSDDNKESEFKPIQTVVDITPPKPAVKDNPTFKEFYDSIRKGEDKYKSLD